MDKDRRVSIETISAQLIISDPAVLDALVTCDESWVCCYDLETKRQRSQWKHAGSSRSKKDRQTEQIHSQTFDDPFFYIFFIAVT